MSILPQLDVLYNQLGIHSLDFRCGSYKDCAGDGKASFTEARSAFVGSNYYSDNGRLPRLVFLSLDPGDSENDPNLRTPFAVQQKTEAAGSLKRNTHWWPTCEFAGQLLLTFDPDSLPQFDANNVACAAPFFANVNVVKCCQNKVAKAMADRRLYRYCSRNDYVKHELGILRPDLLIAQGAPALDYLRKNAQAKAGRGASEYLELAERKTLCYYSVHPTARDGAYNAEAPSRAAFIELASDWWGGRIRKVS